MSPRVDLLLVELGLAPSRERAQALVLAGQVYVGETRINKPSDRLPAHRTPEELVVRVTEAQGFASRGALKLAPALDAFAVDPTGRTCLDVGASTGGFTDVLLRRGAARVYAVDVGYGQLLWSLQSDPRVVVLDRTNVRDLGATHVPEPVSLTVIDVSFISLTLVLAPVVARCAPRAEILAMVKPQFEVGRGNVGKGGVVRDEGARRAAIAGVVRCGTELGLTHLGTRDNEVTGPKGNREAFVHLRVDGVA